MVDRGPFLHRPPDLPRLSRTPLGMGASTTVDKRAGIRGIMQDVNQGGLRRFAPE
jgi:hypothetical protein